MAFVKEKIYKQALKIVKEKKILDIRELINFLPCNKSTFYLFFPAQSEEMETIKENIEDNKIVVCGSLKRKWINSDSPVLQIAAYKLISSDEEAHRLNGSKTESTIRGDKDNPIEINDEAGRNKLIAELTAELADHLQNVPKSE